jgi:hypothetical protein
MKKFAIAASLLAASLGYTSAQAAVSICDGNCVTTDTNVLINSSNTAALTQTGSAGAATVKFTSAENILAPSNGQSRVSASDGILNSLTFELLSGYTFKTALFNLFDASQAATTVTITYFDPNLSTLVDQTFDLANNGQNFMGISGSAGETFTKISFNFTNGGVSDLRQLRLGEVAAPAVPEAATWAMMLAGFGVVGSAMRRRKTSLAFG